MSEDNQSFGSIFASGIQDVAAVLGILGTEMCDGNAALALSKGYLFPAACGMSMFGILGLSKYLLKSFLPERVVKNMGIDRSGFDKYKLEDKVNKKLLAISVEKLPWLKLHEVKIYLDAPALNKGWWMLSLVSCFGLSCLNFVPYIPHYTHTASWEYIYFPLILTGSSFVASYVCCIDAVLMLSGSSDLYSLPPAMKSVLISYHFGNRYAMLATSIVGCVSALGIVIGYLGSYLVVQQMAEIDTYLWLGLELVLCFLRLIIWSLNTEKDDINKIGLRFKLLRTDEKVIEVFRNELGMNRKEALDVIEKIKKEDCYINFLALDLYLQIKKYIHMEFYDIQMYNEADMYVKWSTKERTFEKIAIICNGKGIVLDQSKMGSIVLSKSYNESFDWMDLKKVDKIDSCYVERISRKEKTWYLDEESELRQYNKHNISDEDFIQITNMYKKACHWVITYDWNQIDYMHNSRPGFKDSEKKEFDQMYDVINLI